MKQLFVAGGALRDALLGRAPKDFDLILRGATPEETAAAYGQPAGKCFPVWRVGPYEVALPRRERKVAPGYRGFIAEADGHLPLEEELGRRDFTVNALALPVWEGGHLPPEAEIEGAVRRAFGGGLDPARLVDPFGGLADLKAGVLRAPYPRAFAEDPVRVLRAARFAARYGWVIEAETLEAARRAAPELAAEPAERLWAEWEKACAHDPARFLEVVGEAQALPHLAGLERLGRARGLAQKGHEEDLFSHTLMVLQGARGLLGGDARLLTAALFHDRGKADGLFPHDGPEAAGRARADLQALRAPREAVVTATAWLRRHMAVWGTEKAGRVLDLALELRKAGLEPRHVEALALANRCTGRQPRPDRGSSDALGRVRRRPEAPQRAAQVRTRLEKALEAAERVTARDLLAKGPAPGPALGARLRELRAMELAARL